MMLQEKDVQFYFKNGYLILDQILDTQTLSELKDSTNNLIEEFKVNKSSFIRDKNKKISNHGKMFLSNRCEDFPLMEKK